MRPRVRSTRNIIYVEAERVAGAPSFRRLRHQRLPRAVTAPTAAPAAPTAKAATTATTAAGMSFTGPSPAIRDLRVQTRGEATAVTLLGTSRLIATSISSPKDGPRRVVVDLPNVTSSLPTTTYVGQGRSARADRVRSEGAADDAGQHRPFAHGTYRVESSQDGNDLTLIFDEPAADPFSALQTPRTSATRVDAPQALRPT